MIVEWLKKNEVRIETLELLSVRAFNLLMFAGYDYIHQIAFLPQDKLMEVPRMDATSASEIERFVNRYIRETKDDFFASQAAKMSALNEPKTMSIYEMMRISKYHDSIRHYVVANDIEIERMGLSNRPKNRLISNGYKNLSDIIFLTRSEFQKLPAMGAGSVEEVIGKINNYLAKNETRMLAVISGDESALWDDEAIKKLILNQYGEIGFYGLSLNDIVTMLQDCNFRSRLQEAGGRTLGQYTNNILTIILQK